MLRTIWLCQYVRRVPLLARPAVCDLGGGWLGSSVANPQRNAPPSRRILRREQKGNGSAGASPSQRPGTCSPQGRRRSKPPRLNLPLSVSICVHPWLNSCIFPAFLPCFPCYSVACICLELCVDQFPRPRDTLPEPTPRPGLIRVNLCSSVAKFPAFVFAFLP